MTGIGRSTFGAVAILAAALALAGPSPALGGPVRPAPKPPFRLLDRAVTPKQAIPFSVDPIRVHFRFNGPGNRRIAIRIRKAGTGQTIRRLLTGSLKPRRWHHLFWDGRTRKGRLAPAGGYRVVAGPVGGPFRRVGPIRLHSHQFPLDGSHGTRGYVGEFGAGRVDGRTHEGFDITAACGTPIVAVRSGTVIKRAYDPELYGNFVVLKGEGERRTYKYAHMLRPPPVRQGQKVRAGRRLGSVGQTGNAASTPCHLHIEIRTRGRLLNPEPLVNAWEW